MSCANGSIVTTDNVKDLLKLESFRPHQEIAIQSIIQDQKDALICTHIDYHNQHESADWSISCGVLGADICGELPELSETDAERSTIVQ